MESGITRQLGCLDGKALSTWSWEDQLHNIPRVIEWLHGSRLAQSQHKKHTGKVIFQKILK